jgi:hypothetical protein
MGIYGKALIFGLMANVKQDFRVMSDKRCKVCNSLLKFNLIRKKPLADKCYKCYKEAK